MDNSLRQGYLEYIKAEIDRINAQGLNAYEVLNEVSAGAYSKEYKNLVRGKSSIMQDKYLKDIYLELRSFRMGYEYAKKNKF